MKDALRVDQLTGVFDELSKAKLIDRNVDVYTNAPLIGFLYGRTADLDDLKNPETGQIYNQNVMGDRVIYSGDELQYNFWLIMLLDANYEPDEEKRIDKAFRHYGQDSADEERFDSYVRGGIDSSGPFGSYASLWILQNIGRAQATQRPAVYYPVHKKEGYFTMYPILKENGYLNFDIWTDPEVRRIIQDRLGCGIDQAEDIIRQSMPIESLDEIYEMFLKNIDVGLCHLAYRLFRYPYTDFR